MPLGYIVYDERLNETIEIAEEDGQKFLIGDGDSYQVLHEKDAPAVAGSLWFR